jgi:hypothetical protein
MVTEKGNDEKTNWGGWNLRAELHCIYVLAFLCMLRFDEVLKIQHYHIEVVDDDQDSGHIILTLPFRKTHQFGGKYRRKFRKFKVLTLYRGQTFSSLL